MTPPVEPPIVLRDDPAAATPVTVTGWRSRNGFFYTDESIARYDGCTHVRCSRCGAPVEKLWTHCRGCREVAQAERYAALPQAPWDGTSMVHSKLLDRYFDSPEDAADELKPGQVLADLQVVLCHPNRGQRLEYDYFSDQLPEDGELPDVLANAIDAFNAVLETAPVLSWSPSKVALQWQKSPH